MLTNDECSKIAQWSKSLYPAPKAVVDRDRPKGDPLFGTDALYLHPEDYRSLQKWVDSYTKYDVTWMGND